MTSAELSGAADPGLTRRQLTILQFIEDFARRNGYGPTHREIGEAVGLASPSSVAYQLGALVRKGYLSRTAMRPRTAVARPGGPGQELGGPGQELGGSAPEPGDPGQEMVLVPLVGRIAAGEYLLADEVVEEYISLPRRLVGDGDLIMLKVAGDSMVNAAIADGDFVVVRRESDVENGDIVAAMVVSPTSADREATVKTLKRVDGHLWLIPQNPRLKPFIADNAEIIGKVVTVLRCL